jgi:hypothetical protein
MCEHELAGKRCGGWEVFSPEPEFVNRSPSPGIDSARLGINSLTPQKVYKYGLWLYSILQQAYGQIYDDVTFFFAAISLGIKNH